MAQAAFRSGMGGSYNVMCLTDEDGSGLDVSTVHEERDGSCDATAVAHENGWLCFRNLPWRLPRFISGFAA